MSAQIPWAFNPAGEVDQEHQQSSKGILPAYHELIRPISITPHTPPYLSRASNRWHGLVQHFGDSEEKNLIINGKAHTVLGKRRPQQVYTALRYIAAFPNNDLTITLPNRRDFDPVTLGAINRGGADLVFFCTPETSKSFDMAGWEYLIEYGFAPDYAAENAHAADEIVDRLLDAREAWECWCDFRIPELREVLEVGVNPTATQIREVIDTVLGELSVVGVDAELLIESAFGEETADYKANISRYFGNYELAATGEYRARVFNNCTRISLGGRRVYMLNPDSSKRGIDSRIWDEYVDQHAFLPALDGTDNHYNERVLDRSLDEFDWQQVNGDAFDTRLDVEPEQKLELEEIEFSDQVAAVTFTDEQLIAELPEILDSVAALELQYYNWPPATTTLLALTALAPQISARYEIENYRGGEPAQPNCLVVQVGDSGCGKTPIAGALVNFNSLENRIFENNLKIEEDYYFRRERAKENGDSFNEPPPKTARSLLLTDTTPERQGQTIAHNRANGMGLLVYSDEFLGMMNALNVYTGGKGNGRQNLLSQCSGVGVRIGRMKRASGYHCDHSAVSWLGNTTPDAMFRFYESDRKRHGDGFWQRLLICPAGCPDVSDHSTVDPALTENLKRIVPYYLTKLGLDNTEYIDDPPERKLFPICEGAKVTIAKCLDAATTEGWRSRTKYELHLHTLSAILSLMRGHSCVESSSVLVANTIIVASITTLDRILEENDAMHKYRIDPKDSLTQDIATVMLTKEQITSTEVTGAVRYIYKEIPDRSARAEFMARIADMIGYDTKPTSGGGKVFCRRPV